MIKKRMATIEASKNAAEPHSLEHPKVSLVNMHSELHH